MARILYLSLLLDLSDCTSCWLLRKFLQNVWTGLICLVKPAHEFLALALRVTHGYKTMQIIFMQKRSREIICEARLVVKMDLHFTMQFFSYFSQDKIVRTHSGWAVQTSGVITYQNVSHLLKCHGCMYGKRKNRSQHKHISEN